VPKVDLASTDVQLLEALRAWVADLAVEEVATATSNGHTKPAKRKEGVYSLADLESLGLVGIRKLAKSLGCPSVKKIEIIDWMEKNNYISDEVPQEEVDEEDEDEEIEDAAEDEAEEDVEEEEEDEEEEGITIEDLLDREKTSMPDLLAFAAESGVKVPVAIKKNRKKIVELLEAALGVEEDD
jgi:hypothetical protein